MVVYKYRDRSKDTAVRREINKEKAIEYLGGKCVECGSTKYLEFDHKDPSTKSFTLAARWQHSFENYLKPELDKCQLLCKDCHLKKSKLSAETGPRTIGHGEGRSGKNHCKCDICKYQKSTYYKISYMLGYNPTDAELEYWREKLGLYQE